MRRPWKRREPESPEAALLRVLGAVGVLPPSGGVFFVYGLVGRDGETFYAGKSANILTRLGDHVKKYGDAIADVWLIRCGSDWSMTVTEDFLIDRLQPAVNVAGTSQEIDRIRDRIARRAERTRAVHAALAEQGVPSGRGGGYKAVAGSD